MNYGNESAIYRLHNDGAIVSSDVTPNDSWLLHSDGAIVRLNLLTRNY